MPEDWPTHPLLGEAGSRTDSTAGSDPIGPAPVEIPQLIGISGRLRLHRRGHAQFPADIEAQQQVHRTRPCAAIDLNADHHAPRVPVAPLDEFLAPPNSAVPHLAVLPN